jgi:hypothetical protein
MGADLREAFAFVVTEGWLWRTLTAAAVVLLFYWGPLEVLVPYLVKNVIHGGATTLGVVLAAGGVGSMVSSALVGRFGMPARRLLFLYASWGVGSLLLGGFAVAHTVATAGVVAFLTSGFMTAGWIAWAVVLQSRVPSRLLGRVSSLDWLLSTALIPVSFALVGPVSKAMGTDATFARAGVVGAIATAVLMLSPKIFAREPERPDEARDPEPEPEPEPASV